MIDVKQLWKQRFSFFVKEMQRYLRLIFNDHLKFVLLFAVGGGAYYYQQWLDTVPPTFPAALVISLLISIVLTQSPIRTFLKEADLVFLLPVESKLQPYFRMSLLFSFVIQSYVLLMVLVIAAPLYLTQSHTSFGHFLSISLLLFMVKGWNILMTWYIRFFTEQWVKVTDYVVRWSLNAVLVYFMFSGVTVYFTSSILLIMAVLLGYFRNQAQSKKSLKWEQLINMEAERMMMFYRIANLFTDVPKLKDKVKKRRWLNWLTSGLSFSKDSSFKYIYLKTFARSSDYLGIYIRLLLIGGLLVYFLPIGYGKLVVLLLFLYLSGYQLVTLWRHHSMKIWLDLYPISEKVRKASFLKIMNNLLYVKTFLLALAILVSGQWLMALLALLCGIVFTYVFVSYYLKEKIEKMSF